jgi:hypothetical protein
VEDTYREGGVRVALDVLRARLQAGARTLDVGLG